MDNHFPLHPGPPLDPVFVAAMKHRNGRIASPEERREIAQIAVRGDSPDHAVDGHRDEELDDAVAYARITSHRPTARERDMMAAHGIKFDGCVYRYAGFSFDRLADAMNQARTMAERT